MEISTTTDSDKLIGYMEYLERDRENNQDLILLVRQRIETVMGIQCEPNEFDRRIESTDSIELLLSEIGTLDQERDEYRRKRKVIYERMKELVKNSTI